MTAVYELVKRPTPVLSIMPRSCNLIFDLLATSADEDGYCSLTMAEMGRVGHISRQAVWRALKRLIGARLIEISRHRIGRGNGNWYFVRVFLTGRKKRKPVSDKAYIAPKFFSSPENVTPRHYKEPQKKQKQEASKDPSIKSPGHAMFLARGILTSNSSLNEEEKDALLQAIGLGIFKRGWFAKIKRTPGVFFDSLNLLAQRRPPGLPRRGAPRHWFFSWLFGVLKSMAAKYASGVASVVENLHASTAPVKCNIGPRAQEYGVSNIAEMLHIMDPDPDNGANTGSLFRSVRRRRGVVHRRPTWSERGLVPPWKH